MKRNKILALEYKAAPMGGVIFCDSTHYYGNTAPSNLENDFFYFCIDDIINNDKIPDEEYIQLDHAFFTLYTDRSPSSWDVDNKKERTEAVYCLMNYRLNYE